MDHAVTVEVVECLVDWLTCSASQPKERDTLEALGFLWVDSEQKRGNQRKPWNLHGYSGESSGRAHVASGPAGTVVALSGALADEKLEAAMYSAEHVSRIDLAVTTHHTPGDGLLAKRTANEYDAWRATARKPPKPLLLDGRGEGDTLYIGHRTSDYYFRLYNKGLESRDARYAECWRAECECKGGASTPLALAAVAASDRPRWIAARLRQYLDEHGIKPWFVADCDRVQNRLFSRRADAESKLRWIDSQVMPGVRWLAAMGWGKELAELLGEQLIADLQAQLPKRE